MAKKRQSRKSYPTELEKRAVDMSNQEGVTLGEVADQLGISVQQLSQWRSQIFNAGDLKLAQARLDALEENITWDRVFEVHEIRQKSRHTPKRYRERFKSVSHCQAIQCDQWLRQYSKAPIETLA